MTAEGKKTGSAWPFLKQVTCPHCWHKFRPGEILWISTHADLEGDSHLADHPTDKQKRFLPTRYTAEGLAIDVKGSICKQLACPRCHLRIPRASLGLIPLFISTLGAPSSGKSYFLAAMTWQMRKSLTRDFGISFSDADPAANQVLNKYEEELFQSVDPNEMVVLEKTGVTGDWYNQVRIDQQTFSYSKPFMFSLKPETSHLDGSQRKRASRAMCLYDNAGEHFMPGSSSVGDTVTQHLALSRVLLFLFDPTQHHDFRKACLGKNSDPQFSDRDTHQQHSVILEAANRINQIGQGGDSKYSRPVVVVVTKYDAWSSLRGGKPLKSDWVVNTTSSGKTGLVIERLKKLSGEIREILQKHAPELVSAVEGFAEDVTYIPVSALGCSPIVDLKDGKKKVRAGDINPQFVEIPMLYALHRSVPGLIPTIGVRDNTASTSDESQKPAQPKAKPKTKIQKKNAEPESPNQKPQQPATGNASGSDTGDAQFLVDPTIDNFLTEPAADEQANQSGDEEEKRKTGS